MYLEKVISIKTLKNVYIFCCPLEGHLRKEQDPLIKGTDPRIRICTKMSRILNTEYRTDLFLRGGCLCDLVLYCTQRKLLLHYNI